MPESATQWVALFYAAAAWNIATGLLYLNFRERLARRFAVGTSQDPTDRQLANLLHVYFGVAGFGIAQDPGRDLHLIALWMAAKCTSVVLAIRRYSHQDRDSRRIGSLAPAATDLVWSIAFGACLWDLA